MTPVPSLQRFSHRTMRHTNRENQLRSACRATAAQHPASPAVKPLQRTLQPAARQQAAAACCRHKGSPQHVRRSLLPSLGHNGACHAQMRGIRPRRNMSARAVPELDAERCVLILFQLPISGSAKVRPLSPVTFLPDAPMPGAPSRYRRNAALPLSGSRLPLCCVPVTQT